LKPWKKFREIITVLVFGRKTKNTSGKIPFLLFLFFGKAKKTKIKT
jgi:hypothetical protein